MSDDNSASKIAKLEAEYIKNKSADALGGLIKLSKMGKYDMKRLRKKMKQVSESDLIDEKKKKKQQKGKKRARKVAARKKKKSGKKDACYYKVKSRYKVWPSAYASGALVKCRKVGARNWGTGGKKKNEEIELEEVYLVEEKVELTTEAIEKILRDEGGASGMDPFLKGIDATEKEIKKMLKDMLNVGLHEDGDYILEDGKEIIVNKSGGKSHVEENFQIHEKEKETLDKWFARKGEKGSKGGWVDCNAPDGDGGYKACADDGKRKKYPACRPTPSACKDKGKGKTWGKKAAKREHLIRQVAREEANKIVFGRPISEGLSFHIDNSIPICDNIYRHGSDRYFSLVNESRELWKEGKLNLCEADVEVMESDLGTFIEYRGKEVPLDFPMRLEEKKKKKKDPPLNKPKRNTGSGKKYVVYVRNPKSGNVKKITYGDQKGGLEGNWNNSEARVSYAKRHRCAEKTDKLKAGYWACRAHKDFGNNVPGRFW
jgi:hypothetical protein